LNDASGKILSSNFYWLCSDGDEKADFTDLNKLTEANINVTSSDLVKGGNKCKISLTIENTGTVLAFAVNPKILNLKTKNLFCPYSGRIIIFLFCQRKKEFFRWNST
jgi:hypothetical protein